MSDAAAALTRGLPRDQAIGLRLLAMARAAAGMHMGRVAIGAGFEGGAEIECDAQKEVGMGQILRSQAGGLVRAMQRNGQDARATEQEHGQDARATGTEWNS